jgi:hypothetical protein
MSMFLVAIVVSCHRAYRNGVKVSGLLAVALPRRKDHGRYLEQYEAKEGGVILHA